MDNGTILLIIIAVILILFYWLIFSLCRVSGSAERMAEKALEAWRKEKKP